MLIPTKAHDLIVKLGALAYTAATPGEIRNRLQESTGSAADRLFDGIEILYAFREQLDSDGLTLLGQLSGFASQQWFANPERIEAIYHGVLRDLEGAVFEGLEDPAPVLAYRSDGIDWRTQAGPTLEQLRAAKWKAVKAIRTERETSTAPTPIGTVQIDAASKLKIVGIVSMARIAQDNGQPFADEWTMADNSVVPIDAAAAISMGVAVGQQISAIYERARVLRDAIAAAATPEDLDAIDITAGWPPEGEIGAP